MKSDIRNPRPEGSLKSEARIGALRPFVLIWISGFGFLSAFGIRHSDLSAA